MFDESEMMIVFVKIIAVSVVATVLLILILWRIITKTSSHCHCNNAILYDNMNHMNMISAMSHQNYLNEQAEQRNQRLIDNANTNAQLLLNQQYRTQDLMRKAAFDNKLDRFEHNFNSFFDGFNSIMSPQR